MLNLREQLILKGCRENCEDGLIFNNKYAVVMDGATGLNKHNVTGYGTDAQWLTLRTLEILSTKLKENSTSIVDILKITAETLKSEYRNLWSLSGLNTQQIEYPSAGLIIVREVGDKIQIYRLGDCLGVIRTTEGIEVLKDTELLKLDRQVHNALVKVSKEKSITISESRYTEEVIEVLKFNRSLKNTDNGYWIYDPEAKGINNGEYLELDRESIKSIYIMTDGLSNSIDVYKMYNTEVELVDDIDKLRLHRVVTKLTDVQDSDADCSKFIRTKKMDDVTGIVIDIK